MKKVMIVFGTRPEAIKLCPLVLELEKHKKDFETVVCVTAQHRQMLDQVLQIFHVVPKYDLDIMRYNQSLYDITSSALRGTGRIIADERPDILIVQGDTTTTFASSLAAYYQQIPVGHVEAGLRTWDKYSPFPEEINRKLTTAIADIHFAPTETNKKNLLDEGIPQDRISVTGNTVIDALLWVRDKTNKVKDHHDLKMVDFSKRIILVTGHRRENFGEYLLNICSALRQLSNHNQDIQIVYPVHLNPNVKKPVHEVLSGVSNILLINPIEYETFVYLMDRSYLIISDSGGIQEEAPTLGKPDLVTRHTTERPEAVETGAVKLVGTDPKVIITEAQRLLDDKQAYQQMSQVKNPYGDGHACERIVKSVKKYFSQVKR